MSARKVPRAPKPVPVIDLWRRRMPITMWLVGVDPNNAPAKEREESRLIDAILTSPEMSHVATACKLHLAFEFAPNGSLVRDFPWLALLSVAKALLPVLPDDLAAALKPFVVAKFSHRTIDDAWDMGVKAAFSGTAREIAKATGEAA